jgi:hypothetical protein
MKVVINRCYGGFGISHEGMMRLFEIKGQKVWPELDDGNYWKYWTYWTVSPEDRPESKEGDAFYAMSMEDRRAYNKVQSELTVYYRDIPRNDPALVQMVEELGSDKASGKHSELVVVEIPDDVAWEISEYDGMERVHESHRSWS